MQRTKDSFTFYASSKKAGKSYQNSEKLGKKKKKTKSVYMFPESCASNTHVPHNNKEKSSTVSYGWSSRKGA